MPRKSAVAIATLEPRGRRLEPPGGLSEAERAAFAAAVRSVKPNHFADEDMPLLTAYASAIVQERAISAACGVRRRRDRGRRRQGEGSPTDRARAGCRKPDAVRESLAPWSDGAGPEPPSPTAWHGRGEWPIAVGISGR
jgi:hypothetical protein